MILRETRRVLSQNGCLTLSQLAAELGADETMVAAALEYWQNRGQARLRQIEPAGGSSAGECSPIACSSCPLTPLCRARAEDEETPQPLTVYEWLGGTRAG